MEYDFDWDVVLCFIFCKLVDSWKEGWFFKGCIYLDYYGFKILLFFMGKVFWFGYKIVFRIYIIIEKGSEKWLFLNLFFFDIINFFLMISY